MLKKKNLLSSLAKILKVPQKKISTNSDIKKIGEWDSLVHLEILIKIDNMTAGKASKIKDLSNFTTIKQLYTKLKKKKLIE
jgi:acyl carrier protein